MKRDSSPVTSSLTAGNSVTKLFSCFEKKPLVATVLVLSLVMFIWTFQPYYENLLQPPCNCGPLHKPSHINTNNNNNTVLSFVSVPAQNRTENNETAQSFSVRRISNQETVKKNPNKREFKPYGNAAALFVTMGAYRAGVSSFSVVGLASKPLHVYGNPWYKCEWVPNQNGSSPVRAKAVKILPDWGYGRVYTVVVVTCTFSENPNRDNSGGKLLLYAYPTLSPRSFEKFPVLEEKPQEYHEKKYTDSPKLDYLYCGSSLYGNISAPRMREWMAYHAWFFGEKSHFVFHDAGGVTDEVREVLEPWIKLGRATLQDIREQEKYDGYYYNQFLVVNDCLQRYKFDAKWTFFYDVDEYMFLPDGTSLESVMKEYEGFSQFTIQQNPMSSMLCLDDTHNDTHNSTHQDYSRQWGFEKLVFRDSRIKIRRDRKYAIQARQARATGVHMSENVTGKTLHRTESKIRYYHYHNSIQVKGEPCRVFLPPSAKKNITWFEKLPYVYDDRMKQRVETIKQFERQTLGTTPEQDS